MQTAVNAWVLGRARGCVVNQEVSEEKKRGWGIEMCKATRGQTARSNLKKLLTGRVIFVRPFSFLSRR